MLVIQKYDRAKRVAHNNEAILVIQKYNRSQNCCT